jgi:hypothetical protein
MLRITLPGSGSGLLGTSPQPAKSRELPQPIRVLGQGFVDVRHGQIIAKQRPDRTPALASIADLSRFEQRPTALRQTPIDPFQQHRQLSGGQGDLTFFG